MPPVKTGNRISAGIDIGAMNVKVVVLVDGQVAARTTCRTGFEPRSAAATELVRALSMAGLPDSPRPRMFTTGSGRKDLPADGILTDPTAAARGIAAIDPDATTVMDVGAEEARCVKVGPGGRVLDFVVNEKCAAGTGVFLDAMAQALDMDVERFGRIALAGTRDVPMSAQCAVFAESEVVSLVHSGTSPEDISRAVHDAIAGRIVSMARRVGLGSRIHLIGGVACNAGFVEALERAAGIPVVVPHDAEHVSALGAAIAAAEGA